MTAPQRYKCSVVTDTIPHPALFATVASGDRPPKGWTKFNQISTLARCFCLGLLLPVAVSCRAHGTPKARAIITFMVSNDVVVGRCNG